MPSWCKHYHGGILLTFVAPLLKIWCNNELWDGCFMQFLLCTIRHPSVQAFSHWTLIFNSAPFCYAWCICLFQALVRSGGRIGLFSELSSELLPPEWCGMVFIGMLSERTSLCYIYMNLSINTMKRSPPTSSREKIYMNLSCRLALDRLTCSHGVSIVVNGCSSLAIILFIIRVTVNSKV